MSMLSKLIEEKKDELVEGAFSDEMKQKIVKAINASVDIPLVSEKREEKWIGATWDIICDIIKPLLKKTL
jgi:trans-2-enoyl-CoA reductase